MPVKTGIVAAVLVVKHLCRIIVTWRPAIEGVLAAAVSGGTITAANKVTVDDFLNLATAACDVLRTVTGY